MGYMADNEQKTPDEPSTFRKVLKMLMFPIAGISGLWAAKVSTYNSAYTNAAQQGLMRVPETPELLAMGAERVEGGFVKLAGETGARTKGIQAIFSEAKPSLRAGKPHDIVEKASAHHAKMDKIVEKHMDDIGLGTVGKQWSFMRGDQRQKTVMEGLAVAGIAVAGLGTVLSHLDNKKLAKQVDAHDAEKKAEQGPTIK